MIDVALTTLLKAAAGAATRVTPSTETELVYTQLPRVIYSLIGLDRRYSDDGNAGLTQARYQLDIFADKASQARAVADAIRIGMDGHSGTTDGTKIERIYFDSENFAKGERIEGANRTVARYSQDMVVEYREAMGS